MAKPTPFRYKHIRKSNNLPTVDAEPPVEAPVEGYAGQIDGLRASHGEENVLRAAYQTGLIAGYQFRYAVGAPRNFPGWKELDFLFTLKTGQYVAIQVKDYEFVHHGQEATAQDMSNDAYMLQEFAKQGINLYGNRIYSINNIDVQDIPSAIKILEAIMI